MLLRFKRLWKFAIQLFEIILNFIILPLLKRMFEDNFESHSNINYNMEIFSTYRRRISHFQIQKDLEQSQEVLEEVLREASAKNILIEIDESQGKQPLQPKDQKKFVNGWVQNKSEKEQLSRSFRTKIHIKNRTVAPNQLNSHRNYMQDTEGCIPSLKKILQKLESPERGTGFGNVKENIVYSEKRKSRCFENNTRIPYKFDSAFHTISTRKTSREKRRRIITFSDYKQNSKKSSHLDLTESEFGKMADILVIKQAGKKVGLRR